MSRYIPELHAEKMISEEYRLKRRIEAKEYRDANLEKRREQHRRYMANYRRENPDEVKNRNFIMRDYRRDYYYRQRYGLTTIQVESLGAKQLWLCAICSCPLKNGRGGFSVDHDHKTMLVRGLLCRECNTALGCLKDNIQSCHAMISYLEKR